MDRRGGLALAAALASLLAACSQSPAPAIDERQRIACALGEGAAFARDCAFERMGQGEGAELIVRHPDGGFRRFTVLPGGAGLAAADGAQVASQAIVGNELEVAVAGDRYRIPFVAGGDGTR